MLKRKLKLPLIFKPILWSYDFSRIDINKDAKEIIVNAINYGNLNHWRWLVKIYGKKKLKKLIQELPSSELRPPALELAKIIFNIDFLPYVSRSDKIRKSRDI